MSDDDTLKQGKSTEAEYKIGPGYPPIWGQWKPGQSGNPQGGKLKKKYKEAIERALALIGDGDPDKARTEIALAHLARAKAGDMGAIKEYADREDGKVPTPIGGTDELPAIKGFAWLDTPTLPTDDTQQQIPNVIKQITQDTT